VRVEGPPKFKDLGAFEPTFKGRGALKEVQFGVTGSAALSLFPFSDPAATRPVRTLRRQVRKRSADCALSVGSKHQIAQEFLGAVVRLAELVLLLVAFGRLTVVGHFECGKTIDYKCYHTVAWYEM
jgi:hypothetical protein